MLELACFGPLTMLMAQMSLVLCRINHIVLWFLSALGVEYIYISSINLLFGYRNSHYWSPLALEI